MPKFLMTELVDTSHVQSTLFGLGSGSAGAGATNGVGGAPTPANLYTDAEAGKFVKLVGESRYALAGYGDQLEGRVTSVEASTVDGYSFGGIMDEGRFAATYGGKQADGAAGSIGTSPAAIGDYVVVGNPVAQGVKLTAPAEVRTAAVAGNTLNFKWRIVSFGPAGTGAVGTVVIINEVG